MTTLILGSVEHSLDQGGRTYGPRATCGPHIFKMRSARSLSLKNNNRSKWFFGILPEAHVKIRKMRFWRFEPADGNYDAAID